MSQGAIIPNRGSPVRTQVVHESRRTRITRLFFPEHTLICKEPLGPDAQRRLRHEVEMLQRLRGVDGVAHLVHVPGDAGSIVLEDAGAGSLRELAPITPKLPERWRTWPRSGPDASAGWWISVPTSTRWAPSCLS